MSSLDSSTIAQIARLARIKINDTEQEELLQDMNGIIGFVEQLSELNTDGIDPMTSGAGMALRQRDDIVTAGGDVEAVTTNAPDAAYGFFTVPKVIE